MPPKKAMLRERKKKAQSAISIREEKKGVFNSYKAENYNRWEKGEGILLASKRRMRK